MRYASGGIEGPGLTIDTGGSRGQRLGVRSRGQRLGVKSLLMTIERGLDPLEQCPHLPIVHDRLR